MKNASKLVDIILSGKYDEFKKINEGFEILNKRLKEVENQISHIPNQDDESLRKSVEDEIGGDEEDELISHIEESVKLLKESEYQDFFRKMMKKYGVTSPAQLSKERKSKFFSEVSKEWKKIKKRK